MKFLIVLTYYRPHISGLTFYAELLAKALIKRGNQVTVLTSHHDKRLPKEEILDGVKIVRVPVLFKLSKGVIMPSFWLAAKKLIGEHDFINIHLPQFDSAVVAGVAKILNKPSVVTYHCDLLMPPGLLPWLANKSVLIMNSLTCQICDRIISTTQDYADHSPFLRKYLNKVRVISPPVDLEEVSFSDVETFNQKTNPENHHPIIGMVVRFATEKGIEVVIDALPMIINQFPKVQLQFVGPYKNIRGEEQYAARLLPKIAEYEKSGNWRFLGILNEKEKAAYFKNIDVIILPSLNSTEAFGLVQIEAMISGSPSVASDLPGVRQPVLRHGMGKIVPIGDSKALAAALIEIFSNPTPYQRNLDEIKKQYLPDTIAREYEDLYRTITQPDA